MIPGLGRSPEEGRLPTPVFWPGEFHGLCSLWGRKESDTTERLSLSFLLSWLHSLPPIPGFMHRFLMAAPSCILCIKVVTQANQRYRKFKVSGARPPPCQGSLDTQIPSPGHQGPPQHWSMNPTGSRGTRGKKALSQKSSLNALCRQRQYSF